MKKLILIASLIAASLMTACSDPPPPPPAPVTSFTTVEEQRAQGRANAYVAAAEYQRQNPRILGWEAIVKADTSHTSACPQGDGWAEVVFMRSERADGSTKNLQIEKATVMCSTVSVNEGCVMVAPTDNWSKHPKKTMDGACASTNEVPMPLPKVVGAKS
jgi:hypothetical protein